jgi:hypothetical protein
LLDKFIYKKLIIDNSSKAEVDDYIENEKKFESKESDWMVKSIFREELKSSKDRIINKVCFRRGVSISMKKKF